jgi:hemerythrin-like domain-containing protein
MAEAIDVLVREHHRIEEVLASLEGFIESLGHCPELERASVRDYVRFFHRLVDLCHHGKEEKYLFVRMSAYGFSKDGGPIGSMLAEQDEGRDHLDALASVGNGEGPLTARERAFVHGHSLGYILRIRPHMAREEDILFPAVIHSLPEFVLTELARDFEKFEIESLPANFHEDLKETSARLLKAHPPKSKLVPG